MDELEKLKEFVIKSKENGCISRFLKRRNDIDNLKEDLMRLLDNDLKIDDPPEKFDSFLDNINDCIHDIMSLTDILDRVSNIIDVTKYQIGLIRQGRI